MNRGLIVFSAHGSPFYLWRNSVPKERRPFLILRQRRAMTICRYKEIPAEKKTGMLTDYPPEHNGSSCQARPVSQNHICWGEQHIIQFCGLFSQASVSCVSIPDLFLTTALGRSPLPDSRCCHRRPAPRQSEDWPSCRRHARWQLLLPACAQARFRGQRPHVPCGQNAMCYPSWRNGYPSPVFCPGSW